MSSALSGSAWERGRFDAQAGPGRILFGRMYEDPAIEAAAFARGGRVFCIASAGCTAMALAPHHEVVAVDINRVQLDYAARRFGGERGAQGVAERLMSFGRSLAPLAGWWPSRLREFMELDDPGAQLAFWRRHFDTRRFRATFDALLSVTALRRIYAPPFLDFLPRPLGAVLRARMERGFSRHANRDNPYVRALLGGELPDAPPPPQARDIRLVHADAAAFLELEPAASFDGFALSNILDGVDAHYRERLAAAVRRAAAPHAIAVLRSFREPPAALATNRAGDDRAMLWGIVDVGPAAGMT